MGFKLETVLGAIRARSERVGEYVEYGVNGKTGEDTLAWPAFSSHYGNVDRVSSWLEREHGIVVSSTDEYDITYDLQCKLWPRYPSYHGDLPVHVFDGECGFITSDDDIGIWIDWALEGPSDRALLSSVHSHGDIVSQGFILADGELENGWHPGQTDDPRAIESALRGQFGDDVEVLFYIKGTGQFDARFAVYYRLAAS